MATALVGTFRRSSIYGGVARSVILLGTAATIVPIFGSWISTRFGLPFGLVVPAIVAGWSLLFHRLTATQPPPPHTNPPQQGRSVGVDRAFVILLVIIPALLSYGYAKLLASADVTLVDPLEQELGRDQTAVAMTVNILAIPLVEEFLFREALHREFLLVFSKTWLCVGANAVWFAFFHPGPSIPPALILGLCATVLRIRTRSLTPCVMMHILVNAVLLVGNR